MRRSSSINSLRGGCWVTQAIMPRGGRWASQDVMSRTVMPREAFLFHVSQLRLGLRVDRDYPNSIWDSMSLSQLCL